MVLKTPIFFAHLLLALGTLCIAAEGVSAQGYEAEVTSQVMAPPSLFSGICCGESAYPSCFSIPRCGIADMSAAGFPCGVWRQATAAKPDPSPLRVDNPFFNAPDRKAYGPDESTPRPLRVANPHFGS